MEKQRIVLVEDEKDILSVIEHNLNRENYKVSCATDGSEGLKIIKRELPDLVLLDLMLPGIDGLEICRILKSDAHYKDIPIIMVTAKGDESDIVVGLSIGADDYVTKPFSPKELMARVKAVIRRGPIKKEENKSDKIVVAGLEIDPKRFQVKLDNTLIELTATEFRLILFLASHPGRVFTRDQLLDHSVTDNVMIIDRNVDVHIQSIRKKLGTYRSVIQTIRGVGYRFKDVKD